MKKVSKNHIQCQGFIALTAAILIGALLLLLTATLASSGYALRYHIVGIEQKSLSYAAAERCAVMALATRLTDGLYGGDSTSSDSLGTCYVAPLEFNVGAQTLKIRVQGSVAYSYTILEYVYDVENVFMGTEPLPSDAIVERTDMVPTLLSRRELVVMP